MGLGSTIFVLSNSGSSSSKVLVCTTSDSSIVSNCSVFLGCIGSSYGVSIYECSVCDTSGSSRGKP
jgi:hypothetical protein